MGNMAACLVQQRTTALPAVNPKQRLISLKLLMRAIHRLKKRPAGSSNGKAKIGSKPSSSTAAADAAAAADGSKVGGVEEKSKVVVSNNPKGAVLRSRLHLHGRSGGLKKQGAVRVKVVLTKEEAARLLSLTVGGHKTAADRGRDQAHGGPPRRQCRRLVVAPGAGQHPGGVVVGS